MFARIAMTETAKDGTVLGLDPQVDSQYVKDDAGYWVRKPNVDSRGRTPEQVKVWKAYETHCDFCETCAMYEQGDDTDPCYAGQVLWSAFYGIPYPGAKA